MPAVMKTLRFDVADLELGPIGAGRPIAGELIVRYDRTVAVDGKVLPAAPRHYPIPATGLVDVQVLPNDDPAITSGAGFGIVAEVALAGRDRHGTGVRRVALGTKVVPSTLAGPVSWASLPFAASVPASVFVELLTTVRNEVIQQLGTPGSPAYNLIVEVAGDVYDPATADLLADPTTASGAALDAAIPESVALGRVAPTLDLTGAQDASAGLQAALDGMRAGAVLHLPSNAVIKLSSVVTLTKPVHIDGHGAQFITSGTNGMFAIPPAASNSSFRNMRVQGNKPTTYAAANKAFNITGAPGSFVTGLRFTDVFCDGFGYGGFYGSHVRGAVFRDCVVTNSVYCGFQFLSPDGVTLYNPTIDTLEGIFANGFMQSYPIAWTRDQTQVSITDYPNAKDCSTYGGLIQNVGWEGVDTHGGRNIRTMYMTIRGAMHGIAYVPCPDQNGVDTWGPRDCVAAFNEIDSMTTTHDKATGIKFVGAGGNDNRVEAATGLIMGNKIKGHGRGTLTTGVTADPTTVGGGIQIYQTDRLQIIGNRISEPNPFGISMWYDNTNCQISDNTIVDPWSETFANCAAIAVRSAGNTISLSSNKLVKGSKMSVYVNRIGLYITLNTKNSVTNSGGNDFDNAVTPFYGGGLGTIRGMIANIEIGAGVAVPNVGTWKRGSQWWKSNAAPHWSPGWVCTTPGGATSATWSAASPYGAGVWVKLSTGAVLECVIGGTSSSDTEPQVGAMFIGDRFLDGTVEWIYRSATTAVFTPMPTLGA